MSIVFMGSNTGLQFFALLNLNKASVIVYGWMSPHTLRQRKWLEYFNEVMVMFLSYSMVCMTAFLLDYELIFKIGYVFIILFGVLVVGNLIYISNVLFGRYRRQNKLKSSKEKMIQHYESKFEKLKNWEQNQKNVRKKIRNKAKRKTDISENNFPSMESLNRLSTLNEQEEINYENESYQFSDRSKTEEKKELRYDKYVPTESSISQISESSSES